ncbi:MAG: hypothetical protein KGR69_07880 [Verrucomicrobia bacterium]|nr:hypothetical protein [Verrucomicrobiota bacterium]
MSGNGISWRGAMIALLMWASAGTAGADVFPEGQTGLYRGEGRVGGVVAGTTFPSRLSSAAIRVRPNSLIIDGAVFRLSGDEIRFNYRALGISMSCVGTYRKIGRVFAANGTLDVNSAQLAAAGLDLTGFWNYRLVFNGTRVRQTLGIGFPNPILPEQTIGTISSSATATRED